MRSPFDTCLAAPAGQELDKRCDGKYKWLVKAVYTLLLLVILPVLISEQGLTIYDF